MPNRRTGLCLTLTSILAAAFFLAAACGPDDQTCDPPCGAGKVCKEGACVPAGTDAGGEKTGEKPPMDRTTDGFNPGEKGSESVIDGAEKRMPDEPSQAPDEKATAEAATDAGESAGDAGEGPKETGPRDLPPEAPMDRMEGSTPDTPIDAPPKETVPDGPAPTVSITEPKDGATVSGTVLIKVSATVASGVIGHVMLYVDGTRADSKTRAPFEFNLDTKSYKDGSHKVKAIATTDLGQTGEAEITVKTDNFGPTIKFTAPMANSSVTGKFDIIAEVTDPAGVKIVKLFVDNVQVAWSATAPQYKATYDPTKGPFDSVKIVVEAWDKNDLKGSAEIWLSFDPPPGTKKLGEVCDNADTAKRCVAKHSCYDLDGKGAKCHVTCDTSMPPIPPCAKDQVCGPVQTGTTRGVCVKAPPKAPGSLYSSCGGTQACDSGLLCVGAGAPNPSWCLEVCQTPGTNCNKTGFICVGVTGSTTGVCVEQCKVAGQGCTNYGKCQQLGTLGYLCL